MDGTFQERRKHLADLSDNELKERFWQLADEIVTPLIDIARSYTSPSIERSVLLRMGFSSLEARELVDKCLENRLLGKGAGHVVWRWAQILNLPIRDAGLQLIDMTDWHPVKSMFGSGEAHTT